MSEKRLERWGAATGYLILVLGIVAAAFERGAPPANAPVEESLAFIAQYRRELLAQSLLFVLSAGVYLWFFGSLRSFLLRAEGGTGRLSTVAFGAGVLYAGLQMALQSVQVAMAMSAGLDEVPVLAGMMAVLAYALSVIAYIPLAVLLAAVATLSLRKGAFPVWLGWLSVLAAVTNLTMAFGIIAERGPLVPGGWLTYVNYLLLPLWQLAVTTVMVVRLRRGEAPT